MAHANSPAPIQSDFRHKETALGAVGYLLPHGFGAAHLCLTLLGDDMKVHNMVDGRMPAEYVEGVSPSAGLVSGVWHCSSWARPASGFPSFEGDRHVFTVYFRLVL